MAQDESKNKSNKSVSVTIPTSLADRLSFLRDAGFSAELAAPLVAALDKVVTEIESHHRLTPISHERSIRCSCGSQMIIKTGRKGAFYGCVKFPQCKNTTDIHK